MQERMTSQLADAICGALNPAAVAVVVEAEHLCMVMRGVRRPGSKGLSQPPSVGPFADADACPKELLSMMQRR